jgi:hypothetical protein
VTDNFFITGPDGFKDTSSVRQTFTNPLNGKSVQINAKGQSVGSEAVIDQTANTITFTTTFKGLPEQIKLASGPVLSRDAGLISFADTFDLTTGEFLGETVTQHGPHPEADADFELLCDVITPALTG